MSCIKALKCRSVSSLLLKPNHFNAFSVVFHLFSLTDRGPVFHRSPVEEDQPTGIQAEPIEIDRLATRGSVGLSAN